MSLFLLKYPFLAQNLRMLFSSFLTSFFGGILATLVRALISFVDNYEMLKITFELPDQISLKKY